MRNKKPQAPALLVGAPVHLISVKVHGRAVPWSVPDVHVSRRGRAWAVKEKRLRQWQASVHDEAWNEWGGREPYAGPVGVSFWFYVRPPTRKHWELEGAQVNADLTNLVKAMEDAFKSTIKKAGVIVDDRQVSASHAERYFVDRPEPQRAWAQLWALPTSLPFGPDDSGYGYRPWDWHRQLSAG